MTSKRRHPSFSIIELIISIAILFTILFFAIPKNIFLNDVVLTNEIDKFFSTFTYLQQKSIASNTNLELNFNQQENCYTINQKTHKLPKQIKFGFLHGSMGPPSDPKKLIEESITFKKDKISKAIFYPDGKISPGTIYLVDENTKFMRALTCSISQVSYLRKYKYLKGNWTVY